jgi:meso-butanediol dehydrogenase / (S,S)-butanediol dehydrogenase / diacetyl reductase
VSAPEATVAVDGSRRQRGAVVTGGVGGIGRAVAGALLDRGYAVAIVDLAVPDDSVALQADAVTYVEADVGSSASVAAAVAEAAAFLPGIDLLVNGAGVSTMKHAMDLTDEDWSFVMRVNAQGTFLVSREVIPLMPDGSNVVNVASAAGKVGSPLLAHYAASKFAVVGLTQSLALELAPRIRVNAVCPGYIRTPMQDRELEWEAHLAGGTPEQIKRGYIEATPMGRLGTPQDVARLVCFLASDDADFITGQSINVDGGLLMH